MQQNLPPGPSEPSVFQIARWIRAPIPFMVSSRARFGPIFTAQFPGMPPFVFVSDPAVIRDVFTGDPDDLYAGQGNRVLKSIVGEHSLLLLDGPAHLRERRLVMPPFHGERMRGYAAAMREVTSRVLDALPEGEPTPIHRTMQAITLDVILRAVFGLSEGERMTAMREALVQFVDQGTSAMGTALLFLLPADKAEAFLKFGQEPLRLGPLSLSIARLLPWNRVVQAGLVADSLLYQQIAERRAEGRPEDRADVLSLLLSARDEDGEPMTDEELRDEMMTMLIAGHETSATTLAWTIHFLLEDPEALARVVAEVDTVAGSEPLSPDHVAKLSLCDAAIKESLRLAPIIPAVARVLSRSLTLGGITLPKGACVFPCAYLAHREPQAWPEPERYDLDRFVGLKIDPATYFPFGGGARRCVGMAFATFEMKLVLAELLRSFTLTRAPGPKTVMARRGITLAPSDGVPVLAKRRVGASKRAA